jgi:hypothetical protein
MIREDVCVVRAVCSPARGPSVPCPTHALFALWLSGSRLVCIVFSVGLELFPGGTVMGTRNGSCGIAVTVPVGATVSFGDRDTCAIGVIYGVGG